MVLAFTIASVLSTAIGGVVALRNRDRLHLVLGFTAGVLLGLVLFDLVPELFRIRHADLGGVPLPMVTAAAGFLALHLLERGLALHAAHEGEYEPHSHHDPAIGLASAAALVAHSFLDGVGIGLGFQAGTAIGVSVAIAVVAHDFADGLNTVGIMVAHGNTSQRARVMLGADAVAPLLGAASTLVFTLPESWLGGYLGFFAGFLLYLATSDILPEAHARHPSRLTLSCTVLGVAMMWAIVSLS
ncbi:ZIP family zinc transporter [Motilibacter rhizosphaerae]|uniref:ZIP family zinc transporter n=1 Tax=Motilibacter rhizosphaerae TaxID=598652 RepID=A0A4Q7NRL9_9ACTN|nr:ZIP family metal transporter [Motilibacter rhizosphaerae]RZS89717.1 ZIP family zinc transporter [Motilibacter rhizosphaerae]